MFTLEIGGRPIAMTKGNEGEARAAFAADEFKSGLPTKSADGVPLWNGADPFRVREATPRRGVRLRFVRREDGL